jgi:hypothetical protein
LVLAATNREIYISFTSNVSRSLILFWRLKNAKFIYLPYQQRIAKFDFVLAATNREMYLFALPATYREV